MSAPPDNLPYRRRPWDAWILIALGIFGLLVLVFRRESRLPEPSLRSVPPEIQVSQASRMPDPVYTAPAAAPSEGDYIPQPSVVPSDSPRIPSPPFIHERYTADPHARPMDSLTALHYQSGSSFLPSGVFVTPPGTDAMVWIPLDPPAPDSITHDPFHEALPQGKNTSVTDCLRIPQKSTGTSGR